MVMMSRWMLLVFLPMVMSGAVPPPYSQLQLVLLQTVFRHGDRTPITIFPTDAYKDHWREGLGQLTTIGKWQHFRLGQWVRSHYPAFINETYDPDEVSVRSSDVDRTLMSAYCHLAGLFPPKGWQKWDDSLDWQPIPVHTVPKDYDLLLRADSACPMYDVEFNKIKKSPEMQRINEQYKDLFRVVEDNSGTNVTDIFQASDVYDVLLIEQRNNLTLPKWVFFVTANNKTVLDQLQYISGFSFGWDFETPVAQRLRGGPLLGEMVNNMKKRKDTNSTQKMYIYSGHDTTVCALLSALGVFNGLAPPYAAMVIFELLRDPNLNQHYVQVLYHNSSALPEPNVTFPMALPGCDTLCPLEDFIRLTSPVIPENPFRECQISKSSSPDPTGE